MCITAFSRPGRLGSSAIRTPARPTNARGVGASLARNKVFSYPLYRGAAGRKRKRSGRDAEAALATIDDALARHRARTGQHWFDAELHRIRGEILLKQTPADPAPAEAAFLTAIAVAQSQKARSFELRAALALAKLHQSTSRPIEAHDVLGPALEGFSPTPEFPEIVEALSILT